MLFWWFGHPLVYFWLLPAYVVWYTAAAARGGRKLFSDPLGRLVFAMFVLLSTPVGFHHQFMDPGVSASVEAVSHVQHAADSVSELRHGVHDHRLAGDRRSDARGHRGCSAGSAACRGAIRW